MGIIKDNNIDFETLYNVECENCNLVSEEKIYLVYQSDGYDCTSVIAVFKDKEKAEKYVKIQEEMEEYDDHFYIVEQTYQDDKFDINSKVVPYYSYFCSFDAPLEDYDNNEEQEKRIYDGDLTVKMEHEYVTVYSVKSYEEAKNIAIEIWSEKHENK